MSIKVSAICVSHPSRFGMLQRAIVGFFEQTEPDKELLILVNNEPYADRIRDFFRTGLLRSVSMLRPNLDLVTLRHARYASTLDLALLGMALARGEWIACWDDDDLCHPERLRWQCNGLASVFGRSLYYFYDTDELFYVDFRQPSGKAHERCAPSSLVFPRASLPNLDFGEREAPWSCHVLNRLAQHFLYDIVYDAPEKFLVGSTGDNFRDVVEHRKQGTLLPATLTREQLLARDEEIERQLAAYRFPGGKVTVCGRDAAAFVVSGLRDWPEWMEGTAPPADWHLGIPNRSLRAQLDVERMEETAAKQATVVKKV